MPAPLILAITLVAAIVALRARAEHALAAVVALSLLVPDTLLVPGLPVEYPFSLLTVHRLVLLSFAAGMVVRSLRTPERADTPVWGLPPWRLTAVVTVFVALNIVNGLVVGVDVPIQVGAARFALVADQLVFLLAAVAALRASEDPGRVISLVALAAVAAAAIALSERVSEASFAEWFFSDVPEQRGRFFPGLEERGGDIRVRGPFQFALGFAWTSVLLLPIIVVAARRAHRWFTALPWAVGAGAMGLAVLFTVSRSVVVGAGLGLLVVAVASRDRRILAGTAAVGLAALSFVLINESVQEPFEETRETRSSVEIRLDRFAEVAEAVADQPWTGVGLGALRLIGIQGLDASYAFVYGELGVSGLVAVGLLMLVAGLTALAAAGRAPPGPVAWRAAAGLGGTLAGIVGAAAFDLLSLPAAYTVFWFLVALAVSSTPPRTPMRMPRRPAVTMRAAVVGAALIAGVMVAITAPTHQTLTFRFETTPPRLLVPATSGLEFAGKALARSGCERADVADLPDDGVSVRCRVLAGAAGGIGEVRVQGPDAASASSEARAIADDLREHLPFGARILPVGSLRSGEPSIRRTAPLWLPMLALAGALLLPSLPARRLADEVIAGLTPIRDRPPTRNRPGGGGGAVPA